MWNAQGSGRTVRLPEGELEEVRVYQTPELANCVSNSPSWTHCRKSWCTEDSIKISKPMPKKPRKMAHRANALSNWDVKLCLVVLRIAIDLNHSFKSPSRLHYCPDIRFRSTADVKKGVSHPSPLATISEQLVSLPPLCCRRGPELDKPFSLLSWQSTALPHFLASYLFCSYSRNVIL